MKIILICILYSLSTWSLAQQPDIKPQAQPEDVVAKDPNLKKSSGDDDFDQLEAEILSYLEPYTYDVESRRDPFQPFKFEETPDVQLPISGGADEETDKDKVKVGQSSILNYNLQQLRLKAILWNVNKPKIIVEDPNKRQHTLQLNDKIGNGNGYIAAVREGEVVVVQKIRARGKTLVYTKYMHLKR